ncbi:MAG: ECF transporter S component [Ruminococcaceae bacterium]|nr:ECF transporter S component [Oscillospiraceae bacterium]
MKNLRNSVLAAMFLAIGLVLPFLTGQIQRIGNMLLPMHIPVLLCSFICGWKCGLAVGFILPLLRSVMFGMPPMYPKAVAMAFELAAYGFMAGYIYYRSKSKDWKDLYSALIIAMVFGRLVWGAVQTILLGMEKFTFYVFISGAILDAVPGIIIQLVLIPAVITVVKRRGLLH